MKQAVDTNLYAASVQDSLTNSGLSTHVRRWKRREMGTLFECIGCGPVVVDCGPENEFLIGVIFIGSHSSVLTVLRNHRYSQKKREGL